jgi:hypothetical protein
MTEVAHPVRVEQISQNHVPMEVTSDYRIEIGPHSFYPGRNNLGQQSQWYENAYQDR